MRYRSGEPRPESIPNLTQPRRASGFTPTKPFSHKGKHRKNARPIRELQSNQKLALTPWEVMTQSSSAVDIERANFKGLAYCQPPIDPTPRLVRRTPSTPESDPATFTPTIGDVAKWLRS